jgi:hypothetical protein
VAKRIPSSTVHKLDKPALIAAGSDARGHPITVVPLVEADAIVGLEVVCQCGSHVVIDCVYDPDPGTEGSR